MPGPAFCAASAVSTEDTGADDRADAEHRQLQRAELAFEALLSAFSRIWSSGLTRQKIIASPPTIFTVTWRHEQQTCLRSLGMTRATRWDATKPR